MTVRYAGNLLIIDTHEPRDFTDCDWDLNGDYEYSGPLVGAGATEYPLGLFVSDEGRRFISTGLVPRRLHVHCREPESLTLYREW